MNTNYCTGIALALLVAMGAGCGRMRARKAQGGETADKGGAAHGIALEIDERIDGKPVASPIAQAELAAAFKQAGIDVIVKGNPERLVRGTVEAKLGGQKVVYGITTVAYDAVVTLKVVNAKGAELVESISTQARKTGLGAEGVARDAIKEAVNAAAKKTVEVLKRESAPAK